MYKHRRLIVGIIAAIIVLAMLVSLISSLAISVHAASSSEIRQQIESLQAEADQISAKREELNAQIDENKSETMGVVQKKLALDQQIELTQEEIDNKTAQIQEYNSLISAKQSELDDALEQEEVLYGQYKLRIRSMEEHGTVSYWAILFKSRNFADLLDNINMISEIATSDQLMMKKLEKIAEDIAAARVELEAEKTSLVTAQQELEATEQTLSEQRAESDALIQELLADKAELDASEAYYGQLEDELVAQIAKSEQEYDAAVAAEEAAAEAERQRQLQAQQQQSSGGGGGYSYSGSAGGWCNPVSYIYVTSAYGYRWHPTQGYYNFHSGVDLAASYGQSIYAARGGVVTTATWSDVYGNYVVINHGDGYSTLYGHMSSLAVYAGQTVSGGQTIGYAGSTGWSTGTHLHFTVYYNGSTVNPMGYIG